MEEILKLINDKNFLNLKMRLGEAQVQFFLSFYRLLQLE